MQISKSILTILIALFIISAVAAQPDRWQQRAEYEMEIDVNAKKHQFNGKQRIKYYNNSPDELNRVFYHLYFNAFQPNSMMDVRSRTIEDPDSRVGNRISKLDKKEIGYHKIKSLKQDGREVQFEVVGTILEVNLATPIKPNSSTVFEMEFESQVPLQIRRSGRDNKEGIEFSMAQWYPKLAEYDYQGWHANPYIGREFHGVWGDFDVKISIDKDYVVAATGVLQNPNECGHGYEPEGMTLEVPKGKKNTWHFRGENIHDFVWAADPDYKHVTAQVPDGPVLRFFYQENENTKEWAKLPEYTIKAFQFLNEKYGEYPYPVYSVIQGGDGGMEYPMATLITGHRRLGSLVGVTVHEVLHSWFQMILGTNESLYAWMDEGFTSYASNETMAHLFDREGNVHSGSYQGYVYLAKSGKEEPMTTHADHFKTNFAYGSAAYTKGAVFLGQLKYIIGEEAFDKGMLSYFETWKFKHPNPNDFIRIMEKESGLELDWYKEHWVFTTNTIDYGIKSVEKNGGKTDVVLERIGTMPMPIDLEVEYEDGSKEIFYMPLRIMRGEKPNDSEHKRTVAEDWPWTHPTYTLTIPEKVSKIKTITIDPAEGMADIDRKNNVYNK